MLHYRFGVMGVNWASLPASTRKTIMQTVSKRFPRFESQGVSNILYGMALMQAMWWDDLTALKTEDAVEFGDHCDNFDRAAYVSKEYMTAACNVISMKLSRENLISGSVTSQATSNIIYSLGGITHMIYYNVLSRFIL